nr:MAG TPA: hypothetical protein [Caudoviricetes sp.]
MWGLFFIIFLKKLLTRSSVYSIIINVRNRRTKK